VSLYVYASFAFAKIGAATFNVTDGTASYDVTIDTLVYTHVNLASVDADVHLFSTRIKSAIEAAATLAGSAHTFTVAYDEATRFYTITPDSGTIAVSFSVAGGVTTAGALVAKHVLGRTSNSAAAATFVSNACVYYAIATAEGAQMDIAEYEPGDIADVAEGDDGSTAMVARTTAPMYYDCTIPYETRAAVYTHAVVATVPFTWQMFFAHVRTQNSVVGLKDSGLAYTVVMRMRKDGVAFVPEPPTGDKSYQAYLHIQLRGYLMGRA